MEKTHDNSDLINFSKFTLYKKLGSGAFGTVFLAKYNQNGFSLIIDKFYAIKVLLKRQLIMKQKLKYAITEANILKSISHPFILSIHYAFQTP
jgi:serine/threonine protein kinase